MNIIDVIEAEGVALLDKGTHYKGLCPLHEDKTPSFVVFKKNNRFKCFGCGARGDAIDFIMAFKEISFTKAVEYLDIPYDVSQVFIPYPPLIDTIVEEEKQGVPVKDKYRELLIAMGWIVEE